MKVEEEAKEDLFVSFYFSKPEVKGQSVQLVMIQCVAQGHFNRGVWAEPQQLLILRVWLKNTSKHTQKHCLCICEANECEHKPLQPRRWESLCLFVRYIQAVLIQFGNSVIWGFPCDRGLTNTPSI